MTAAGLNILNYIGPLRKNKNGAADEDLTFDKTPFEFDRFKRHLNGLLERLSRMVASSSTNDHKSFDSDETIQEQPLKEEDDTAENNENSTPQIEEESDWVFDVKQAMDVLPRLHNPTDTIIEANHVNDV